MITGLSHAWNDTIHTSLWSKTVTFSETAF